MIVATPAVTPVTIPVDPTVAIDILLLLHVPPVVISDNVIVLPGQTCVRPVIDAGAGFTVIGVTTLHPVGIV